jgi:hypothetical protein
MDAVSGARLRSEAVSAMLISSAPPMTNQVVIIGCSRNRNVASTEVCGACGSFVRSSTARRGVMSRIRRHSAQRAQLDSGTT